MSKLHILGFVVLAWCGVMRAAAADGRESIALARWTAGPAARVEAMADGLLRVDYESPAREPVRLAPRAPVILPGDLKNLSVWCARAKGDFSLGFDIIDAAGAHHELKVSTSRLPHGGPVGWDQKRAREWSIWSQAISYRVNTPADIGARVLPEFLDATRALEWPRPLALAGIVIRPAASPAYDVIGEGAAVKAGVGQLYLADLAAVTRDGFEAEWSWAFFSRCRQGRDESPVLFPDDLTVLDEAVRHEVVVRRGYQGDVVWRGRGEGTSDRKDPAALYRGRITLPELPRGRYFVDTKVWRPDGTFVEARRYLELVVLQNRHAPVVRGSDAGEDSLRIISGRPSEVFPSDTTLAELSVPIPVSVRERFSAKDKARLFVSVVDYDNRSVLRENHPLGAGDEVVRFKLPVDAGMEYFVVAELLDDGRLLDSAQLHVGVESLPESAVSTEIPAEVPDRDDALSGQVHYNAEYWVGDRSSRVFPWITDTDREAYDLFLDQAVRAGAKSVSIGDLWGNHEMLPGVFQWRELDRRIAAAASRGLKVFLAYTADGSEGRRFDFPMWLDAAPRLDQSGNPQSRSFAPSWWDPAVREGWLRYYRRLVEHVRTNPNVIGYRLSNYQLAAKTAGWGVDPFRLDYSEPARREFSRWAASWGGDAGNQPSPKMGALFSLPGVMERDLPSPDLSRDFRAFVDFATYSHHARLADFFATIRALDPRRQIQVDQKPFPYAIERSIPLLRDGGVLKNEDSPTFNAAMLRSMCVQAGVPYAEELHNHMPTSRAISDATNFWHSYLSDHLFWLMRWMPSMVVKGEVKPPADGFSQKTPEALLDYQRETLPNWEEWIRAKESAPEVLVYGSRADRLLGDWRTGGDYGIAGATTFQALFSWHQVPSHFGDEYTDWVRFDRFKAVFVCGEVMAWRAIERVAEHARAGGRIVLVGAAGKYCPERPSERDVLAGVLGKIPGAQVMSLPEPKRRGSADVPEWQAPYGFDTAALDAVLKWAEVDRLARVSADPATRDARFECQLRRSADGDTVYVAVMRSWIGGYHNNIENEGALLDKYGLVAGEVTVVGLTDGAWSVQQFHREAKYLGVAMASSGVLSFKVDATQAGEVRLYRLSRVAAVGEKASP